MDKHGTMEAMGRAEPSARVDMDDLRIVPLGDASALVAYRASARRASDEEDFEAVIGSVYGQAGWGVAAGVPPAEIPMPRRSPARTRV